MFEKPFKVLIVRHEFETLTLVKSISLKTTQSVIRVGTNTFAVKWANPSYRNKFTRVYFIDYETGSQMVFKEIKSLLNPKELDLMVSQRIIKDLAMGLINNSKEKLLWALIGGAIGGLSAALIVSIIYQNKIDDLAKVTTNITPNVTLTLLRMIWMIIRGG